MFLPSGEPASHLAIADTEAELGRGRFQAHDIADLRDLRKRDASPPRAAERSRHDAGQCRKPSLPRTVTDPLCNNRQAIPRRR